ncbi:MAG: NAD-dependent epimerase/dehydratase family protein [bacterium]
MPRKKYKNFLVTGVSGYYGSVLLRYLSEAEQWAKIVGIDIKKPKKQYPFLDFRKMDIRDPDLEDVLKDEGIDTVAHLAFPTNVFASDRKVRDINISGARNMLDCSVRAGVKKFVYISSTTAYGAFPENEDFVDEAQPIRATPDFFYTRDKVEIEKMMEEYRGKNKNIKFVVIRPSIITGEAIHHIFLLILRILYFIPAPAGVNPMLQAVHEDDLARATWLLLSSDCEGTYNITGDGGVPVREFFRMLGKRPLPISGVWIRKRAKHLEKLGITVPIAGMIDLLSYPWTVSNEKIKKEFDFVFEYDSRAAFQEFAKQI